MSVPCELRLELISNYGTIFFFKGYEGTNWSGQNGVHLWVIFEGGDFFLTFSHHIVLLVHNGSTSLSEKFNEFGVVEGEYNISNFDFIDFQVSLVVHVSLHIF